MKAAVLALVRRLVGLFYRRIEVSGLENLPADGPLLLVANHNNGLVDPMVVLRALPRPVVFVAKSTLWKIPVLRSLLDLLGCVPVVRRGEGETGNSSKGEERNRGLVRAARGRARVRRLRPDLPGGSVALRSAPLRDEDGRGESSSPFRRRIPCRSSRRALVHPEGGVQVRRPRESRRPRGAPGRSAGGYVDGRDRSGSRGRHAERGRLEGPRGRRGGGGALRGEDKKRFLRK